MSPGFVLSHRRYQPGEILGEGGQGTVLRVVDREDPKRELVAKVYRRGASTIPGEFALLSRSRLPGLVRAHDLAKDEITGAPFLVEDFVTGVDAGQWLSAAPEKKQNVRLVSLLAQVGATLSALHEMGFVHGDLKPAHVRFSETGRATLLDLGSAVLTRDRSAPGEGWATTRGYAAPELLTGGAPTVASDLYALGALAWRCCSGSTVDARVRPSLRELAPWVTPSLADLVERLVAAHPMDRPKSASDVLASLGASDSRASFAGDARLAPIGREGIFEELLDAGNREPVRYVVGPSGSGKSHLARALLTAALLQGTAARIIGFSDDRLPPLDDWLAFFRGDRVRDEEPLLLLLDDLHRAPTELLAALDLYRCRPTSTATVRIIAMVREAPPGAVEARLEPLDDAQTSNLLRDLSVRDEATIAELVRASGGSPGWIVASLGRVPLSKGAALERTKGLSRAALRALGAIAAAGGALSDDTLRATLKERADESIAELLDSALVTRSAAAETTYALSSPHLAGDLAETIADFEIVDAVAEAILASTSPSVAAIAALAAAPNPPTRRTDLLRLGIARARDSGLRESEMDLLFALAADPRERTAEVLIRLERLTRDTGRAALHPEVMGWLAHAASESPPLLPLALRRQAETQARGGAHAEATKLIERAMGAARDDDMGLALCFATAGAIALYRADWAEAERSLSRARNTLPANYADQEELARLEHNFGVVALYRGHPEKAREAFVRSLSTKRRLGDRAGIRACLLNLGITLAKLGHLDEADVTLQEAVALAEALGQTAGRSWCLAARADVEVRRKDSVAAERWIAEAEALGDAVPNAVRADLAILRSSACLLEGDGAAALVALVAIDPSLRESDALVDSRALVSEARAHLALLPVDRRKAARLAVRAIRRSRAAQLPEGEQEARAVLAAARPSPKANRAAERYHASVVVTPLEDPNWEWMASVGEGISVGDAAFRLAQLAVGQSRAERAFVALVDDEAHVVAAWGADIDRLPIADAEQRLPRSETKTVLRKAGPSYYRDLETPFGTGSRLAVASGKGPLRAVVVVEHRFRADCFDAVPSTLPERWATLAGILGRLWQAASAEDESGRSSSDAAAIHSSSISQGAVHSTTSIPLRAPRRTFPSILGESRALVRALAQLDAAIDSDLPVLITGETGTGKELFARALHDMGRRARFPFVAVNCGAIPEALFEAEFFGHARGSFTGADRARRGLLASAERGTLLLDEVGELPSMRQASLLRALESKKYRAVGSNDEQSFDVRVVAATHRDLGRAADEGSFRRDLLFRLNVIEIKVPALRDREGDIEKLAYHFLRLAGSAAKLTPQALEALQGHDWPGNVRELEHHMQRLAALSVDEIGRETLPREIRAASRRVARQPSKIGPDHERREVERALAASGGNISHAAERLGVTRHGLKKRMVRLGMRKAAKS